MKEAEDFYKNLAKMLNALLQGEKFLLLTFDELSDRVTGIVSNSDENQEYSFIFFQVLQYLGEVDSKGERINFDKNWGTA